MSNPASDAANARQVRRDPWFVRVPLILVVVLFLTVMVVAPLVNVFAQAFSQGAGVVVRTLSDPNTRAALRVTVTATLLAVVANLTFGLAASWAIARFRFPGKALLTAIIDLPFAISPVIAGLIFVLLFGAYGFFGPLLAKADVQVVFALPGIVLATTFVTFPFIARELIPVLEATGSEEEQAALTLGASGWQMFWHITLPNVKWGLLYGLVLCNARAMGEFGAVSVVSGKLSGKTDTLPLYIEKLYQGMGKTSTASAFSVAALFACLALITLALKSFLEWKTRRTIRQALARDERGAGPL